MIPMAKPSNFFKLQAFFILLKVYNFCYWLFFPFIIRRFLLFIVKIKIGKDSIIQPGKFFTFGKMVVGNNCVINSGCYLDNRRGIFIGNNVVIAHNTKIYTLGHDYNDPEFITKGAPVRIESYVVIFANAMIMPGVTIGEGAIVLPGAVVTKDVESKNVVGGNPAKFIKMRSTYHDKKPLFKYWFSI